MGKYKIICQCDNESTFTFYSDSRNTKKHGRQQLGNAGGGRVDAYLKEQQISAARYTPEMGGQWHNVVF